MLHTRLDENLSEVVYLSLPTNKPKTPVDINVIPRVLRLAYLHKTAVCAAGVYFKSKEAVLLHDVSRKPRTRLKPPGSVCRTHVV